MSTRKKVPYRDFPGGLVAKTPSSHCRGCASLIPDQGTRTHMLKLIVPMPQLRPSTAKYINNEQTPKNFYVMLKFNSVFFLFVSRTKPGRLTIDFVKWVNT